MLIDPEICRQFDKLPPHSIEAEMCLLACLMLCDGDRSIFATVRGIVSREAFYQADHQIIFDILCSLQNHGGAIDAIVLIEALKQRNLLEEVGGNGYIAQILNKLPSAAHFEHYAKIVADRAKWREVIRLSNDSLRSCYAPRTDDEFSDVDTLLGKIASDAARIATNGKANEVYHIRDILPEVLGRKDSGEVLREPTGFTALDDLIGGFAYGEKVIVGGKPGMGKSAWIKALAANFALAGLPVGIISVEEKRQKIVTNLLSQQSGVPNNRIEFNTAGREEWEGIEVSARKLAETPILIVDSARRLSAIVSMINVLVSKYGCRALFIDHLHIIDGEPGRLDNRNLEVSKISAELKWVWKDLNVIGVEAAQLNRSGSREPPSLENLRDSGTLEADADTVILLHREDYYHRTEPGYKRNNTLDLILAKNKHGATAMVPLYYDEARYLIRDLRENEYQTEQDRTEGMFQ